MTKKILVTGGAGYIGAIMVAKLRKAGYDVLVFDKKPGGIVGDITKIEDLQAAFRGQEIAAVFHFAGLISMEESTRQPGEYFRVNTFGALNLLEAMRQYQVNKLIFSSTAGVYGNPQKLPIPEDHLLEPTNPYGESKLAVEKILNWYDRTQGLRAISLRYFNAAGASLDNALGERHEPETHIIPLALQAVRTGKEFRLYGTDYPTPDGTCVRDYIHVEDLCQAHLLALEALWQDAPSQTYNVGTGVGISNLEIIKTIEAVTGRTLTVMKMPRRPGDAVELVADVSRIKKDLHFSPQYSDLKTIVETAWAYSQKT